MVVGTREKRQYRDCYGNRAMVDIDSRGIVLVFNPYTGNTVVHYFKTVWGATQAMRELSGTTWTEVSRECLSR